MSGEEIKKLVAIVAQNQTQITSLIELVKKRTLEDTPTHQIALDLQIAQQARETCVVQIAERFLQEPIEVAPEPSVALPVHMEPVDEQPVYLEPSTVHAEARAIEHMPVPKHLEPFLVCEEPSPVHNSNELILEYPDWSRYRVSKEPIVDPRIDDDSITESELLHFANSDFDDLPESIDSAKLLAIGSEKRSARCNNQQSEDQIQQVVVSADHTQQPGSHRHESYGHLTNNSNLDSPPLPDLVSNTKGAGET